jgi:UDP-glucose 4-epimerase
MRILVTGGAGFIGSHVVDAYVSDGHEVTVIDDLSKGKRSNVNPAAHLIVMDVRDPGLDDVFSAHRFDVVNHHAAQIDVRRSVDEPSVDASINILGTLALLQASRAHGVRKFIFVSSGGAIYGECGDQGAREEDPLRPESPYGVSKACAEFYVRLFGDRFPTTILRYANVYGPRQDPRGEAGVITVFIEKILSNNQAVIYGTGEQTRDFIHVADVVEANRAALHGGENRTLNIGTRVETSVNALYEKLARLGGSSQKPVHAPARPGEIERSLLNPANALRHLGWHPTRYLEQGLEGTLDYFRQRKEALVTA